MPISMQHVRAGTKPLRFVWDKDGENEETGNVVYRPASMTPNMEVEMAKSVKEDDPESQADALARITCRLVVSWDFTGEGGETIPLEPGAIRDQVPTVLLIELMRQIREDAVPNRRS